MVTVNTIVHGQSAKTVREGINDDMTNLANGVNTLDASLEVVTISGTDTVDFTLEKGTYDCTVTVDAVAESGRMSVINYSTTARVEQAFVSSIDGDRYFRTSALGNGTDWDAWTLSNPLLVGYTLKLDPQAVRPAYAKGKMWFDYEYMTPAYYTDVPDVVFHVGIDLPIRIVNKTGVAIPAGKAIRNGGIDPITGEIMAVLAKADNLLTSFVIGFTVAEVPIDGLSFVNNQGHIHGINTSLLELGKTLFLSDIDAGEVTQTQPNIASTLGTVQTVSDTDGEYFVKIDNLITFPQATGFIRGQNSPLYSLDAIPEDIVNYTFGDNIIMEIDLLAGTITTPLSGIYHLSFTAVVSFLSLTSTRTVYFDLYNVTQDEVEGTYPMNIPRDATEQGVSFTAPFAPSANDTYIIRVHGSDTFDVTFDNIALMMTSNHLSA